MKTHAMIDIETFDTKPSTAVASVGIVIFNKTGIKETHYIALPADEQINKFGRTVSVSTVAWWMKQGPEAQKQIEEGNKKGVKYRDCVKQIHDILKQHHQICVWGNGANFDITILESLFNDFNASTPYRYYDVKCFRTICNLYWKVKPTLYKNCHNALMDAENQADHLLSLLEINPNILD